MEFNNVRKWMQKMTTILDVYSKEESFTQSEKNLLLDYNQKIKEAILTIKVEDEAISDNELSDIQESPAPKTKPEKRQQEPVIEPTATKPATIENTRYQELFTFKKVEDLSEQLDSTPISSIQKAMGLNERILTQNELFGGDKNSFDNALQRLNSLESFEEARNYLSDELIPQYDWMDEKRIKKAQWFIKLIKRKYS
ncbi:MAG: hypothetical protein JNL65_04470 [Saprospiraceae bacterium]|nr:hypothetical protein [Saprospiraceae bacterium]HRG67579.1 hypothetical protein [Saprospiraceae bacterium]